MQSFADFKRNMQIIENKIGTDNIDPEKDLANFITWIDFFRVDASDDPQFTQKKHYFNSESLVKVTRSILRRKYLSGTNFQYELAKQVLVGIASYFADLIDQQPEGLTTTLSDLLDPNQPFYQKYGFPKAIAIPDAAAAASSSSSSSSSTVATAVVVPIVPAKPVIDMDFINQLNIDDVVDYLSAANTWETGIVASFSNQRKDIEILNLNTEKRETLPIATDGHRIARAFTKAGSEEDSSVPELIAISGPTVEPKVVVEAAAKNITSCAEDEFIDVDWLSHLLAGNIVDAKNKSGTWNQACILEIRTVETTTPTLPSSSLAPPLPEHAAGSAHAHIDVDATMPTDTTDANSIANSSVADISLGDIDICISATPDNSMIVDMQSSPSVTNTPQQQQQRVDESTYSEIIDGDSFVAAANAISSEAASASLMNDSLYVNDISQLVEGQSNQSATAGVRSNRNVVIDARVSYLGFPEKNDEWIPLYSGRIKPLNTMSGGKRGDLPIREEVHFVASQIDVLNNANLITNFSDEKASLANQPLRAAISRVGPLYSPFYVDVINSFSSGFIASLQYLRFIFEVDSSIIPIAPTETGAVTRVIAVPNIVYCLDLAAAIVKARVVMDIQFLKHWAPSFIKVVTILVKNMNYVELRNIGIEKIEAVLQGMEGFSAALYGRNINASEFEYLWLDSALFILDCPYLNKRLGGLKLLGDLIKRVTNAQDSNCGLKSTITTTTTATTGNESVTEVSVSYRVVPVVYSLTITFICERILQSNVLVRFFRGENAHYSLVARAGEIFKTLARENLLQIDLIVVAWEAGQLLKMSQAYQLLADAFTELNAGILLQFTRTYINEIDPTNVTVEIVDVVSAIGLRCRSIVLGNDNAGDSSKELALQLHASAASILWDWASSSSGISNTVATTCQSRLEGLVSIGANPATCIVNNSFPWQMQFERTKDIVESVISALAGGFYVSSAVAVIQACINAWPTRDDFRLNPVLLQASLASGMILTRSDFAAYLDHSYSIIELITNAIATNRIKLFNLLPTVVPGYNPTLADSSNSTMTPPQQYALNDNILSLGDQTKLNSSILQNSRSPYKDTLDVLLNFLHVFVRCSDGLVLSQKCINEIWKAIVMNPITIAEVNSVMNFLSRIIIKNVAAKGPTVKFASASENSNATESTNSTNSANNSSNSSAPASAKRISVCDPSTVYWIFSELLCEATALIQSSFFTTTALDCVEKYFRWLNSCPSSSYRSQDGTNDIVIIERNDATVPFIIVDKTEKLLGLDIFNYIVLNCSNDALAASCVKLLTSLPRRLSAPLVEAGELTQFRTYLLNQCLELLQILYNNSQQRSDGSAASVTGALTTRTSSGASLQSEHRHNDRALKRLLMLLDGLLEESTQDCYSANVQSSQWQDRLRPHGASGHGEAITLNISYSNKALKHLNGHLACQTTDSVGIVWDKIAARANREASSLKFFRLGKEIDANDRGKTLAQLKCSNLETILVGEKQNASNGKSTSTTSATTETPTASVATTAVAEEQDPQPSATSPIGAGPPSVAVTVGSSEQRATCVPFTSLPAVVLSHSRQHFHLFLDLLSSYTGPVCDDIWELLNNRLPTAPFALRSWLELDAASVEELLLPELTANGAKEQEQDNVVAHSLAYLVYSLQIIDILMQPAKNTEEMLTRQASKAGLWSLELSSSSSIDEVIQSWPQRFILKGGINAIMKAFAWIVELLEFYCTSLVAAPVVGGSIDSQSPPSLLSLPGITPALLLQAIEICTTMLRAFAVRAAHVRLPGSIVHALALKLASSSSNSSTTVSDSSSADGKKKEKKSNSNNSNNNKNSASNNNSNKRSANLVKKETSLLANEWGWRLEHLSELFASHCTQELDLPSFQRFVVLALTLLRSFSRCKLFNIDGIMLTAEKAKLTAQKDRLLHVLQHLFACWLGAVAINPAIVRDLICEDSSTSNHADEMAQAEPSKLFCRYLFSVDYANIHINVLLDWLLTGNISQLKQKLGTSQLEFENQLAKCAENGLLAVVDNIRSNSNNNDIAITSESHECHLKQQIILSILKLRPPILYDNINRSNSFGNISLSQYSSMYHSVFSLARKLFIPKQQQQLLLPQDHQQDDHAVAGTATVIQIEEIIEIDDEDSSDAKMNVSAVGEEGTESDSVQQTKEVEATVAAVATNSLFLDESYRVRIGIEIFEELVAAHSSLLQQQQLQPRSNLSVTHIDGTLSLLTALISGCDAAMEKLLSLDVVNFVLNHCLGLLESVATAEEEQRDSESAAAPILCTDDSTRSSAYLLLGAMCEWRAEVGVWLFKRLAIVHNNMPPSESFGYKPERETRSSSGYVGIKNMGCTCYMNSLLQVLFTLPSVRDGIMSATYAAAASTSSEEDIRNDVLLQLKKLFLHLKYSEAKAVSPDDWVYAYKDETGALPVNVMNQQDAQEFLQVLTDRLEQSLSKGEHRIPSEAIAVSAANGKRQRDILKTAFGGNLCNLMIKNPSPVGSEEESVSYSSSTREQQESFVCISVDVKGSQGLEDSLRRFVAGETIADFKWEDNKPRVNITKHQCVSELSDTLIFHLKRFELNYDTLRREKVNDLFPFPKTLNMKPFTREYLLSSMNNNNHNNNNDCNSNSNGNESNSAAFKADEYYEFELRGVVVHSGTSDSGHYFSYIKVSANSDNSGSSDKWLEFNDSEIKDFSELLLDSECFGGSKIVHEISSKVSSSYSLENQKNAYMLVYSRVKKSLASSVEEQREGVTDMAIEATTATEENANESDCEKKLLLQDELIAPLLRKIEADNKKLRLSQRIFAKPHLEFVVNLLDVLIQKDQSTATTATATESSDNSRNSTANAIGLRFVDAQIIAESILFSSLVLSRCAFIDIFVQMNSKIRLLLATENGKFIPKVPHKTPFPLLKVSELSFSSSSSSGSGSGAREVSAADLVIRRFIRPDWMEQLVMKNLIAASESQVRMSFSRLLLAVFAVARFEEGEASYSSYPVRLLKVGTMTSILNGNNGMSLAPMRTGGLNNSVTTGGADAEDAELALAIKLSQSELSEVKNSAAATFRSFVTAVQQDDELTAEQGATSGSELAQQWSNLSLRLLVELTMEWRLVQIAEHWRKADAYTTLLKELCLLGPSVRFVLVTREVVWQLIDIYLGDNTPMYTDAYPKGSRKRAPSSYVNVGPNLKSGALPAAGRNIPDWTQLLETVNMLVTSSSSYSMVKSQRADNVPPTLMDRNPLWTPRLETQSADLAVNKTFTATILKQARYTPLMTDMFMHQSYLCEPYISELMSCFFDALTMLSYDSIAHIFVLMERILLSRDEFTWRRAEVWVSGTYGLIALMHSLQVDITKNPDLYQTLCVFIRSFLHLVDVVPQVRTEVQRPSSYSVWAPWMLKTMYQYKEKCAADLQQSQANIAAIAESTAAAVAPATAPADAAVTSASASVSTSTLTAVGAESEAAVTSSNSTGSSNGNAPTSKPSMPKGPYLIIYGESEAEREHNWAQRSEKTFQLLREVVNSFGVDSETLIPADAFLPMVAAVDDPELAAAKEASVLDATQSTGTDMMGIFDGMTDDELAAYFNEFQ